ncbi:MAG: hypothetical protein JJ863_03260 [Deltaproteobacteria bacterium]|nr:hypothetical protein [Deltaproteobacteria bacterium]
MNRVFALMLLAACAPTPVVTGGGTAPDGAAWFAVTEGKELTFYRCERSGCVVVPRMDGGTVQPETAPVEEEPAEPEAEDGEEATEESDAPDEERMDLMEGVF